MLVLIVRDYIDFPVKKYCEDQLLLLPKKDLPSADRDAFDLVIPSHSLWTLLIFPQTVTNPRPQR